MSLECFDKANEPKIRHSFRGSGFAIHHSASLDKGTIGIVQN